MRYEILRQINCGHRAKPAEEFPSNQTVSAAQIEQAIDNLETVLRQAEMDLSNVVRLTEYTTDVDAFLDAHDVLDVRLANCRPTMTLIGVTRLAIPELIVEFEAIAVG